MEKSLKVSYTDITISEFYESYLLKKYDFEPEYQRDSVWSLDKRQFLIDSILKNFPIPPIFLKMNLDSSTGKTIYDVIDGKQRLTSIIMFIENKIFLPDNFSDGPFGNEVLNGRSFSELDSIQDYKRNFWSYKLPIAYIDTDNGSVIDGIFERLNRNGMPLTLQELRNAKFSKSALLRLIKELAEVPFWVERLKVVKTERLEHHEFISELLFMLIKDSILDSSNKVIDELYKEWDNKLEDSEEYARIKTDFLDVTSYLESLDIPYEKYRFNGISHLYALWVLSKHSRDNAIKPEDISPAVHKLAEFYRASDFSNGAVAKYKKSMSNATRQRGQRLARVNALVDYVNENNEALKVGYLE